MIGGQEVSWEYDEEMENAVSSKPQETFPAMDIPPTRPPTYNEKLQVECFRSLRKRIHDGPLYTVLGDDMKVGKQQLSRGARFNPFTGMPTYAQKYKRLSRRYANFSTRTYSLQFFPQELWEVIDPSRASKASSKRSANTDLAQQLNRLEAIEDDEGKEEGEEGDQVKGASDDDARSEDPDEDFSDESEDMAPDYNAENYFDGGDDDGDDMGDEDGGGGGDYD